MYGLLPVSWKSWSFFVLCGFPSGFCIACDGATSDWIPPQRDHSPAVFQREQNDCGLAALATILEMLGKEVDYDSLLRSVEIGSNGLTMEQLSRIARDHGVKPVGYRFADLRMANSMSGRKPWLALLGTGSDGHYVVVRSVVGDTTFVFDPAVGGRLMKRHSFEQAWTGYALLLNQQRSTRPSGSDKRKSIKLWP